MKIENIIGYLQNCILLLIPIMLWNVIFAKQLPPAYLAEIFQKDIPPFITGGENFFRTLVFVLPVFMPLRISTSTQKFGVSLYILGVLIYFGSWLMQMYFQQSDWSLSAAGFLAPAYTPLIWLVGIGLIGRELYFPAPYKEWFYMALSTVFLAFHVSHTWIVYSRI